jgi:hypothetical protein
METPPYQIKRVNKKIFCKKVESLVSKVSLNTKEKEKRMKTK